MTYEILRVGLARGLYFWCIGNPREAGFQRGISPMVGDTACGREGRRDARPESLFWALARHLRAQNRDSGPKVGRRARDHRHVQNLYFGRWHAISEPKIEILDQRSAAGRGTTPSRALCSNPIKLYVWALRPQKVYKTQ